VDTTIRLFIGLSMLFVIEVVGWTTIVYLVRRWNRVEPAWPWLRTLGGCLVLGVIVTAIGLVPLIGRFGAVIASLVGLKRLSGLDVLSSFILSFCVGLSIFVVAGVISNQLRVDLLGLRD
jgi:hypothetical protein